MRIVLSGLLLAGLTITASLAGAQERKMAITFDDLPIATAATKSETLRLKITIRLLHSLVERDIPAIGFVNEGGLLVDGEISEQRVDLLRLWLAAGLDLGNHSWSHPDLHRVSPQEFIDDVTRGDAVTAALLEARGRTPKYFRHPYLHTGRSLDVKKQMEDFLDERGYKVAPVTVDNSEWIFALAYDIALVDEQDELAKRIGRDYVNYMMQMVRYYEDQSQQLFARNIRHVMLLHANQLNSVWFGELADHLAETGYEFVSIDYALLDPAYASEDKFTGAAGKSWLHRWAITRNVDRTMFHGEPETPAYVLKITQQREGNN